jgi:hypothetical protein
VSIEFQRLYKYRLLRSFTVQVPVFGYIIDHPFIKLDAVGMLTVEAGYSWDGPSGPAFDTDDFMRGSAVHDALYQLMRWSLIPRSCRRAADRAMKSLNIQDGMGRARAWYTWAAVRLFAFWAVW